MRSTWRSSLKATRSTGSAAAIADNLTVGGPGGTRIRACSVRAEILEPVLRQRGVTDRVLNVFVSQVALNRSRVLAPVREEKPASVSEHVGMSSKPKAGQLAGSSDDLPEPVSRQFAAPFRRENVPGAFAGQFPQSIDLAVGQRMCAFRTLLGPGT